MIASITIPAAAMMVILALLCILAGYSLYKVDADEKKPTLLDLLTSTDKKGIQRFDARKCFEAGAFGVSTWGFVFITLADKMTEFYMLSYMGAWVGARFLRDREKRLELTKGNI